MNVCIRGGPSRPLHRDLVTRQKHRVTVSVEKSVTVRVMCSTTKENPCNFMCRVNVNVTVRYNVTTVDLLQL
jgi:Fe-S-cluster-containing hydrogenase component 2